MVTSNISEILFAEIMKEILEMHMQNIGDTV